jgi:hypothetical protein
MFQPVTQPAPAAREQAYTASQSLTIPNKHHLSRCGYCGYVIHASVDKRAKLRSDNHVNGGESVEIVVRLLQWLFRIRVFVLNSLVAVIRPADRSH